MSQELEQLREQLTALKARIREQKNLLNDALPYLVTHYDELKSRTDRSAIHQSRPKEIKEIIDKLKRQISQSPASDDGDS